MKQVCRFPRCRREIIFAAHWSSRTRMVIDARPVAVYTGPDVETKPGMLYLEGGLAYVLSRTVRPPIGAKLFVSHYSICPEGKTMREYQQAKSGDMAAVRRARARQQAKQAQTSMLRQGAR